MTGAARTSGLGIAGLALLGLTASCSCEEEPTASSRVSKVIGREGGSISSRDGALSVTIPPDALDDDVRLTIEPSDAPPPEGALGGVWEIGPPGTEFDEPVTLSFHYDPGALGGRSPEAIRVGSYVDDVWICLPMSAAHTGLETVVTVTMHLSIYAIHFNDCDAGCEGVERCIDDSVCGLPCADASECPFPLDCRDGMCNAQPCEDGAGCAESTVCADPEVPSLCLPACAGGADGVGATCGDPPEQMACTFGGRCVFEQECPDETEEIDCGPLERVCWHQWCIDDGGGVGPIDITGDWAYTYSCVENAACVDECVDDRLTIEPCPDDGTLYCNVDAAWPIRGTLVGNVFEWEGGEIDVYEEHGIWTFDAAGFHGFTCYDYVLDGAAPADCFALAADEGLCHDNGVRAPDPAPGTHDPLPPCICE